MRKGVVAVVTQQVTEDRTRCDHVVHAGVGWVYCARCGSRCKRGPRGDITQYARGRLDAPNWSTNKYDDHEGVQA